MEYLNKEKAKIYGIIYTYKIMPKNYYPYKWITINIIGPINFKTIIAAFLCIKYTDNESLIKIFGFIVNTDFDSKIKA